MVRIGLAFFPPIVIAGLAAAQPTAAPGLSPGGEIAFSRIRGEAGDIYVVSVDGSGLRRLTRTADDDWEPSWSPDGRWIAFMRFRGRDSDIYVVKADGSTHARLVSKSGFGPQWSPNGREIAFLRRDRAAPNRPGRCALYIMKRDGTKQRKVAARVDQPSIFAWSPRGRRIAFASASRTASRTAPGKQIRVVDSGRVRNLTPNGRWNWGPTWSPNGRRIAFWRGNNDDGYGDPGEPVEAVIQVINADGTRARRLTATGNISLGPAWSSSGRKIAFLRGDVDKTLWVMNHDGSGQRKLATQVEPQTELVWKPLRGSMALDMANSDFCRAA